MTAFKMVEIKEDRITHNAPDFYVLFGSIIEETLVKCQID